MDNELERQEEAELAQIASLLADGGARRSDLISLLQWVQNRLGYISGQAIGLLADHLGLSPSQVFGVASFYNQFRFNPPGKYQIKVCLGTACHVCGGDIILENFERKLEIEEGQTTEDREFSIERVACVGCCALAPVTVIGETVHGHMAPSKVESLILRIQLEKERAEREQAKDGSGG